MKKKPFLILLVFIILSISQVNNIWAFLDSDLGLDMYNELDEWIEKLEESQYIYELSSWENKDISRNINKHLQDENISGCIEWGINSQIVNDIANSNIEALVWSLKKTEECWYDPETGKFDYISSRQVLNLISEIGKIKERYETIAESKSKAIYEISRIWMYSDWSTENSPFDIIRDIQDIDKIIFTEDIEYRWDKNGFLSDLVRDKFNDTIDDNLNTQELIDNNKFEDNRLNNNLIETWIISEDDDKNINQGSNSINLFDLDPNSYVCKNVINESWLDDDSLEELKDSLSWNLWDNTSYNFNYGSWWHVKLNDSNKIDTPDLNSSNYLDSGFWNYSSVNDNSQWWCSSFFCIVIDFVINRQDALGYWKSKSIENILLTSNKHLKKAANTSLVQSKMATNNFEMSLRDLDLPSMFHMWFVITKKSPPILDLENIDWNSNNYQDDEVKTKLREIYKNYDLDYDDSNDLNKFQSKEAQMLSIIHTAENRASRAEDLINEYREIIRLESQLNNHVSSIKASEINNDILKEFNLEFTEIEQFTGNMLNYVTSIDALIKKLNEIPTYSW